MSSDSISPGHNDVSLDDLPRLQNGEVQWRPVRRALEVTAFGVNGYTATQAGVEVIEEHDETSSGAGRHEELYLVITGAADFEVGDELIRAGQGHLVRVSPMSLIGRGMIRTSTLSAPTPASRPNDRRASIAS